MGLKTLRYLSTVALLLALVVVMLGAYTRLSDAGLGCPDWPGCYGHLVAPMDKGTGVQILTPDARKAWTEMVHRYAAGMLVLLIFSLGIASVRCVNTQKSVPWAIPLALTLLVVFQAALGMWTVTLKLLPVVVMGHLLGGMLIFSFLCCFRLQLAMVARPQAAKWRFWIGLGLLLVFCQIALGGWVSSNYAGIACIGFPRCNGQWLPAFHLHQGFNLFSAVGANYQGGLLDNDARVTIQFIHRLGAVLVATYVLVLTCLLWWFAKEKHIRRLAMLAAILVALQFVLGIMNVVYLLPIWVAVLHNGVAALLLASFVMLRYLSAGRVTHA